MSEVVTSSVEEPEEHLGIIRVSPRLMEEWGISLRSCDTQGMLEDAGRFEHLHQRLLLPASYTVRAVFFNLSRHVWDIGVESPDLPVVPAGEQVPQVIPHYVDDGKGPQLERIEVEDVPISTS